MKAVLQVVRVGKDVEIRTVGGKESACFSVVENKTVKGEKVATWFNIVYYDTKIANLIGKGSVVSLEGEYYDKPGKDGRTDRNIFAKEVHIFKFKEKGEASGQDSDMPF